MNSTAVTHFECVQDSLDWVAQKKKIWPEDVRLLSDVVTELRVMMWTWVWVEMSIVVQRWQDEVWEWLEDMKRGKIRFSDEISDCACLEVLSWREDLLIYRLILEHIKTLSVTELYAENSTLKNLFFVLFHLSSKLCQSSKLTVKSTLKESVSLKIYCTVKAYTDKSTTVKILLHSCL